MGRVIRHRWDYGAIILVDERFGSQGNIGQMSAWLKSYIVPHPNFGQAVSSLTQFFKVTGRRGERVWGLAPTLAPNSLPMPFAGQGLFQRPRWLPVKAQGALLGL
jgi:hypothetical protein